MVASIALFAFVVTFDNVVDCQSNYDFVRPVLSMDRTFPGNAPRSGRAITAPRAWTAACWITLRRRVTVLNATGKMDREIKEVS